MAAGTEGTRERVRQAKAVRCDGTAVLLVQPSNPYLWPGSSSFASSQETITGFQVRQIIIRRDQVHNTLELLVHCACIAEAGSTFSAIRAV